MLKLVYGCLAFSAVALTVLVIATAGNRPSFRGTTHSMATALTAPATVLDADARGAITQTGNGTVAGYERGADSPAWSVDFKRFPDDTGADFDGLEPHDAAAWCSGDCPAAIVSIDGKYRAVGSAPKALADQLNAYSASASLLDVLPGGKALISQPLGGAGRLKLLNMGRVEVLPASAPSVAIASANGYRVIAGSARSGGGVLSRSIRTGGKWVAGTPDLTEPGLQNLCISSDGRWVGAVSNRLLLMPFIGASQVAAGNPVAGGICRADQGGFTFAVNPQDSRSHVAAVRFAHDGRRIWARSFGAQKLISPTGSPLIVTWGRDDTISVVDAVSGRALPKQALPQEPFVGGDGSIVIASRGGFPTWVKVER